MPKLHQAALLAVLVAASSLAPAQHLRRSCRAPSAPPPQVASVAFSESAYGGGVALAIGGLGLAVRLRRR